MTASLLFPIAMGGALGAVLRFILSTAILRAMNTLYPYGTLGVNVLGSFVMGALMAYFAGKGMGIRPETQAFLTVGLLGGFTTFSAFSMEVLNLLQRGETLAALSYAFVSIFLTIAACALGFWLVKTL